MTNFVTFGADSRDFSGDFGEGFAVERCSKCRGDIWIGETYGRDERGRAVCIDCARRDYQLLTPWEQLELLGFEPVDTSHFRRSHFRI